MLPAIALLIDISSEVVLSVFNAIKQHAVQIQKMPHSICEAALARSGTTEKPVSYTHLTLPTKA